VQQPVTTLGEQWEDSGIGADSLTTSRRSLRPRQDPGDDTPQRFYTPDNRLSESLAAVSPPSGDYYTAPRPSSPALSTNYGAVRGSIVQTPCGPIHLQPWPPDPRASATSAARPAADINVDNEELFYDAPRAPSPTTEARRLPPRPAPHSRPSEEVSSSVGSRHPPAPPASRRRSPSPPASRRRPSEEVLVSPRHSSPPAWLRQQLEEASSLTEARRPPPSPPAASSRPPEEGSPSTEARRPPSPPASRRRTP